MRIVEKYVAAAGAASFQYENVTLSKDYILKQASFASDFFVTTPQVAFLVYKATVTAYAVASNVYIVYAHRFSVNIAGASYAIIGWYSPSEQVHVNLPAGSYTFAVYCVNAINNVKFAYHLQEA